VIETRLLAREAGVEGITREHEQVVLQLGDTWREKRIPIRAERYRGRLRIGSGQLRLDLRGLRDWQPWLRELLKDLVGGLPAGRPPTAGAVAAKPG